MFAIGPNNVELINTFRKLLPKPCNNMELKSELVNDELGHEKEFSIGNLKYFYENLNTKNIKHKTITPHSNFNFLYEFKKNKEKFNCNIHVVKMCGNIYNFSKYRNKYQYTQFSNVVCYGIKVYDIFNIYANFCEFDQLEESNKKLVRKILRVEPMEITTGILCSVKGNKVNLLEKTSMNGSSVNNFSNKLVLFDGMIDVHNILKTFDNTSNYYKDLQIIVTREELEQNLLKLINNIANIIDDIVKCILNIYNFDLPYESDNFYHIFNQPRSLLSILKEFHPGEQVYHRIKNAIKPSEMQNIEFTKLANFLGKQSRIVKLQNYDKIYFFEWSEQDDIHEINCLVNEIIGLKICKSVSKYYYNRCDCLCVNQKM